MFFASSNVRKYLLSVPGFRMASWARHMNRETSFGFWVEANGNVPGFPAEMYEYRPLVALIG